MGGCLQVGRSCHFAALQASPVDSARADMRRDRPAGSTPASGLAPCFLRVFKLTASPDMDVGAHTWTLRKLPCVRRLGRTTPLMERQHDARRANLDRQRLSELQLPDRVLGNRRSPRHRPVGLQQVPRRRKGQGLGDHASAEHARARRSHGRQRPDDRGDRCQAARPCGCGITDQRHRHRPEALATRLPSGALSNCSRWTRQATP